MIPSTAFVPIGAPALARRSSFTPPSVVVTHNVHKPTRPVVTAVAAKPPRDKTKKLSKVEGLKVDSKQLRYPLVEQLSSDEIFINENAVQIMKFHGSYQQDDRDLRAPGTMKKYQFMLRLKMPAGEFPASLYQVLDDISTEYGNNTLRATTRCAWQIHGILKGSLKPVFSKIMNAGGSCVGACGDLSRNVMCTPAPFVDKVYSNARFVSKMLGELFAPQTGAFSEIWLDGEKAASIEFWKNDIDMNQVQEIMRFDNGNGVVFQGKEEPIYGETYLPRKFKIGVTVPGDNSIDVYTQDIGIVCVPDGTGEVVGYNIIVGGGMGRMHRKETTFARTGDHLGYVPKDKLFEACKAIVATQRDHGNRTVRVNARMKYLVDKLGIDSFRSLVETYFGENFQPYRELPAWKYEDWLGWHEQGDGNLFLGLFIENGRIKDEGDMKLRTGLRRIIDAYGFDMVISPNQNVILKNIAPAQREGIEAILKEHCIKLATEYSMNRRLAMACPAMPLCGLAITEAERHMPTIVERMNKLFATYQVTTPVTMRMTGCPNGCARPYMAELGFVGSGPNAYQVWLGGSPGQTRLAWPFTERTKDGDLENVLEPVVVMYSMRSQAGEAFGDFCHRMGKVDIDKFVSIWESSSDAKRATLTDVEKSEPLVNNSAVVTKPTVNDAVVVSELPVNKPRITVAKGSPKITVLPKPEPAAKSPPKDPVITVVSEASAATGTSSESSVEEAKPSSTETSSKKSKPRPRLTVSTEIMERLKNIAALRDISASKVADEIIAAYLSGVDDEDLVTDE